MKKVQIICDDCKEEVREMVFMIRVTGGKILPNQHYHGACASEVVKWWDFPYGKKVYPYRVWVLRKELV